MAARTNRPNWRFYVYLIGDMDAPDYIGKGSGNRLRQQRKNFGSDGNEIARFKREDDAYKFEREKIAELSPFLNKGPGGNGSRVTPAPRYRPTKGERDIVRIGSRRFSARMLINKYLAYQYDTSNVVYNDDIKQTLDRLHIQKLVEVAYGQRC